MALQSFAEAYKNDNQPFAVSINDKDYEGFFADIRVDKKNSIRRCYMDKLKISPFVKWVGGKKQLLERLEERMPETYGRYYEPFIGGGALLLDIQPKNAVINDVNE